MDPSAAKEEEEAAAAEQLVASQAVSSANIKEKAADGDDDNPGRIPCNGELGETTMISNTTTTTTTTSDTKTIEKPVPNSTIGAGDGDTTTSSIATEKAEVEEEDEDEEEDKDHDDNGAAADENGDEDDDGEPIPSGTGSVSKLCSDSELVGWSEVVSKWHSKLSQRPKGLNALVRNGIPEPLRGEVWQLLSGAQQCSELMERYRIFLTQSAPTEQIILRDVHRTYPAHKDFREGSSSLPESLFKVCKAYAVYDEEVGYCQGLSFLVAALLLHMPEEQAFCAFVRIMQHYGLRDLFRNNFDELYLKFYQLEHLLEDHMPDLHQHFTKIGIETFTYASQWFLTVFTAKFPLNAVFYIMDIFLLDGMNTIFQIALALLSSSKQELLALDFEGVLRYFRVQMPKRYINQENVQQLILASSQISLKRLKKHAKNYELAKQKEKLLENPLTRLQHENSKLAEHNLRLEREYDDLARELVTSKMKLRAQLDELEDKSETLNHALVLARQDSQGFQTTISDMEDERARLEVEVSQLKEVCRRELQRAESEQARDSTIISDYKKICSQLSKRLDEQVDSVCKFVESVQDSLRDNESCKDRHCLQMFQSRADELIWALKSSDNQLEKEKTGTNQTSTTDADDVSAVVDNTDVKSPEESQRRASSDHAHSSNRPIGAYIKTTDCQATSSEAKIQHLTNHIDELEVELARTKLALVEAECKCQQLTHDLSVGVAVKQAPDQSGGLSGRLDFMKAAVATRRSPKAASTAFAKINNLISEKISNISAQNIVATPKASASVAPSTATNSISSARSSLSSDPISNKNNNNSSATIDRYQNQC